MFSPLHHVTFLCQYLLVAFKFGLVTELKQKELLSLDIAGRLGATFGLLATSVEASSLGFKLLVYRRQLVVLLMVGLRQWDRARLAADDGYVANTADEDELDAGHYCSAAWCAGLHSYKRRDLAHIRRGSTGSTEPCKSMI